MNIFSRKDDHVLYPVDIEIYHLSNHLVREQKKASLFGDTESITASVMKICNEQSHKAQTFN